MIIELHGHQFKIFPSETITGIQVGDSIDGITQILAHPHIPHTELVQYLTSNFKQIKEASQAPEYQNDKNSSIQLFDHPYTIRVDTKIGKPFLKGMAVHVPAFPVGDKAIDQLKNQVLYSQIMANVSFWEETLDFMLKEVVLKKLRIRYFVIHKEKEQIVFSKKLIDTPLNMLHFIVAKGIFTYLKLTDSQAEELHSLYVPDWKHLCRVLEHESSS